MTRALLKLIALLCIVGGMAYSLLVETRSYLGTVLILVGTIGNASFLLAGIFTRSIFKTPASQWLQLLLYASIVGLVLLGYL